MDNYFDIIVLGTGLTESITAAALSKAGFKVAHIDQNPYYGADQASLSLDELTHWLDQYKQDRTRSATSSGQLPPHPRQYSVSLAPSVIPSIGPFISSLIASGVARYGSFKLLDRVVIHDNGVVKDVPQSKDSIFQNKAMSLLEKRRVMRFLIFAGGEFESSEELQPQDNSSFLDFLQNKFFLTEPTARAIAYALAYCNFVNEPTLPALHRIRASLKASGRYGPSSFLVGFYGGAGEIVQGFCRASAVSGGVYILGRSVTSLASLHSSEPEPPVLTSDSPRFVIEINDLPDRLRCQCLISSLTLLPEHLRTQADIIHPTIPSCSSPHPIAIARCIAIVDGSIDLPCSPDIQDSEMTGASDSSLLVFPPKSLEGGSTISAVHVMTAGPGTMSAPAGKGVLYISMALSTDPGHSAETLLYPYLAAVLSILRDEEQKTLIFSTFYMQQVSCAPITSNPLAGLFAVPSVSPHMTQGVDEAAIIAEDTFWKAVSSLKGERKDVFDQGLERNVFWPSLTDMEDGDGDDIQW